MVLWLPGPDSYTGEDSAELLAAVLRTDLPVLVDADGLTILAEHRDLLARSAPTLITPHAGELSRLSAGPARLSLCQPEPGPGTAGGGSCTAAGA